MLVAIASITKEENSEISTRGGRAPFYQLYENKKVSEVIKNPFSTGGGAGFAVAKMLSDKNVNLVVAGKIGDKMGNALSEKGIDYREMTVVASKVGEELS